MRRRPHRQQVEHHRLAISVPSKRAEAIFRSPIQRECFSSIQRPGPFHPVINCRCITPNLVAVEVLAASQRPTKQDRHIDRRNFGTAQTLPCPGIDEVIQETMFRRSMMRQKIQGSRHPALNLHTRSILPLSANAQSGQAESCGSNARHTTTAATVCIRAVKYQPGFGIRLIPEKLESCALELIEQRKVAESWLRTRGQ